MDMDKNNISGPIPSSFGNCTNLTYINLSRNIFEGLIPSELGSLVNLVMLDLSHNNLEGLLPLQMSNCIVAKWVTVIKEMVLCNVTIKEIRKQD
jgi:Leucine-rich repeat (LRR) protein